MHRDLTSFLRALESAGELVRITEPTSPVLEITELAQRQSRRTDAVLGSEDSQRTDPEFSGNGGKAILIERPEGSAFPVLINAFGSYKRVEMALGGRALEDTARVIGELTKPEPPRSIGEAIGKAKQFYPLLKIGPKRSKRDGACQEVVHTGDAVDLTTIPILRCWEHDGDFETLGYPAGINDAVAGMGHPEIDASEWDAKYRGRFITLAGIHTIHADDRDDPKPKSHNIGMYRVQLLGKDRMAMHWHMHHDGAAHWRSWKKLGKPMPVAIVLGGPSVLPYAATCPLPPGISELLMAGFLQGEGVKLCRAKTVALWVPSDAEMVIEGFVDTDAGYPGWDPREDGSGELGEGAVFEGPFGDHTGFYSMPDRYPITSVTAFTHRRDAVYPTTVVGLPPQEDYFLGKATERIMLPLLKTILPDVMDYDLPLYGCFHNAANIQIKKHYPLHARKVMHAIWGAGQMAWTKTLFVVEDDVDVHDLSSVMRAVWDHCKPSRDIERVHGAVDILDHAAARFGTSMKLGFDATRKVASEDLDGQELDEPSPIPSEAACKETIAWARSCEGVLEATTPEAAPGWVFIRVDRGYDEADRAGLGGKVLDEFWNERTAHRFVVVVGRDVDIHDHHEVLFHWVANCDFARDAQWDQSHGCDRVGFDATPKTSGDARNNQPVRAWPPILTMPDRIKERCDELS
ncbi:MAG: UbiD family decarboxylase [Phycisphaerales bacterium]|nr:UbiD family decarboxylase [Phycisphaerales bacterium]